jgi:hypothetical protein
MIILDLKVWVKNTWNEGLNVSIFGQSLTATLRWFDVVTFFVQIGGNNMVAKIWTSMEQNETTFGKDL